jgi:hypothetical protein
LFCQNADMLDRWLLLIRPFSALSIDDKVLGHSIALEFHQIKLSV